jgi:FKBP-type peptidyl-prolyl cis-trans isomerase (trigger factor)
MKKNKSKRQPSEVTMSDVNRVNEMFDALGKAITESVPDDLMQTHAGTARSQAFLRLQESHMWFGNSIAFMQHMDLLVDDATEQALKEGTIVNLPGGGNHGGR